MKAFKITSTIATTNLVCFDKDGKLKKYETPEDILRDFYPLRLEYYEKRKVNRDGNLVVVTWLTGKICIFRPIWFPSSSTNILDLITGLALLILS